MASPVKRERVDLPRESDLLVPGDPLRQARSVGGGASVGIEDRGPRRGEVWQLLRLAQGEPAQLGQQIAEVQRRITARAIVEVEEDDRAGLPPELHPPQ